MNVQGLFAGLDALGNVARDILGTMWNAQVDGVPPLDVWSNLADVDLGQATPINDVNDIFDPFNMPG